jgi:hypothetical protein
VIGSSATGASASIRVMRHDCPSGRAPTANWTLVLVWAPE